MHKHLAVINIAEQTGRKHPSYSCNVIPAYTFCILQNYWMKEVMRYYLGHIQVILNRLGYYNSKLSVTCVCITIVSIKCVFMWSRKFECRTVRAQNACVIPSPIKFSKQLDIAQLLLWPRGEMTLKIPNLKLNLKCLV